MISVHIWYFVSNVTSMPRYDASLFHMYIDICYIYIWPFDIIFTNQISLIAPAIYIIIYFNGLNTALPLHWRRENSQLTHTIHSRTRVVFTHLPLDKMSGILTNNICMCNFMNENLCILIRVSLKFVHSGPIDIKAALLQVMGWHRTGDKPLAKPMLTQFTGAYMRHSEEVMPFRNTSSTTNSIQLAAFFTWIDASCPCKKILLNCCLKGK